MAPTSQASEILRALGGIEAKLESLVEAHRRSLDNHEKLEARVSALEHDKTAARTALAILTAAAGIIGGLIGKLLTMVFHGN